MQHLLVPNNCVGEAIIKVPYLGLVQYDEGGFFGYLERKGVREADVVDFRCQEEDAAFKLSYIQEWLFFGALHEFATLCDVCVDLRSFIEVDGEGTKWITTLPLKEFASRIVYSNARVFPPKDLSSLGISESWSHIVSNRPIFMVAALTSKFGIPEELQSERCVRVNRLMKKANSLDIWHISPNQNLTLPQCHILWSIGVLLESIQYMSLLCFGKQPEMSPRLDLEYVASDMRRRGWCPSRLNDKKPNLSPSLTYLLSSLASSDHRMHQECSSIKCSERPLALTKPNVGHDAKTCDGSCSAICVNEHEIVRILTKGEYPIIKISLDTFGDFHLTALTAEKDSRYIAISHVW